MSGVLITLFTVLYCPAILLLFFSFVHLSRELTHFPQIINNNVLLAFFF